MITKAISNAFQRAQLKHWDRLYFAFDIHETMIEPNWQEGQVPLDFYPHAMEVMQLITARKDIVSILFTCSHPHEIKEYLEFFKHNRIRIDYVNENPEALNIKYGHYDKKPYFNVLFEDKAGFDPHEDWLRVKALLETFPLLCP
ncbi:MAG: hypothetical protein AAFO94_13395 [Bacteroidota bacterium]